MQAFKRRLCKGQSMIEFVLILPILFIFLLATFEWGQIFIKHIRISTLSREAAIAASQNCKDINAVPDGETKQECVNRIQQEIMARAAFVLPDFQNRGFAIVALITVGGAVEVRSPPSSAADFGSRYAAGIMDPAVLNALGTVAICEFFYDNPVVTPVERLFNFIMPRMIYKTAYA